MKNKILFWSVALILLGLNVNSVNASNCGPGDVFHSVTGVRCTTAGTTSSSTSLTIGSRGSEVRAIQQILKNEGYSIGTIDGNYGKRTAKAVREFQDDNDLPVTGIVEVATRAALNSYGNIPTSISTPTPSQPTTTTPTAPSVPSYPTPSSSYGSYGGGTGYGWGTTNPSTNIPTTPTSTCSTSGYDSRTGFRCGCNSASGFSLTTGLPCGNSTIVTPSITVLSPNGGESYTAGGSLPISFTIQNLSTNLKYEVSLVGTGFDLDLGTVNLQSADIQRNTFTIPHVPTGQYRIRVLIYNGSSTNLVQDQSNSNFTITGTAASGCTSNQGYSSTTGLPCGNIPIANPLVVSCTGSLGYSSTTGGPVLNWHALVGGGVAPYRYSWSAYNDVSGYTDGSTSSQNFSASYASTGTKQAIVRVTDSSGGSATTGTTISSSCSATIPTSTPTSTFPSGCSSNQGFSSTTGASCGTGTVTTIPTTTLSVSTNSITLGQSVNLSSTTTSFNTTLRSAAIDQSTDNSTWTSGSPCPYWSSATRQDGYHIISCSFTPTTAGTYYFRARGADSIGYSNFVYQTLTVTAPVSTQPTSAYLSLSSYCVAPGTNVVVTGVTTGGGINSKVLEKDTNGDGVYGTAVSWGSGAGTNYFTTTESASYNGRIDFKFLINGAVWDTKSVTVSDSCASN